MTNSLEQRIAQHKSGETPGFTKRYGVDRLVYFRGFGEVTEAIRFEKQLKRWRRDWKIRLIETENPDWTDLYVEMMELPPLHPDLVAALAQQTCVIPVSRSEDRDLRTDAARQLPADSRSLIVGPGLRLAAKPG